MSQNKLLAGQINKAKNDIKTRYLAGEPVMRIAKSYGVSDRNIYYHLGELSPDDKALHTKNMDLRRIASKGKEVSAHEQETESNPSQGEASKSSLADFVEPEGEV